MVNKIPHTYRHTFSSARLLYISEDHQNYNITTLVLQYLYIHKILQCNKIINNSYSINITNKVNSH